MCFVFGQSSARNWHRGGNSWDVAGQGITASVGYVPATGQLTVAMRREDAERHQIMKLIALVVVASLPISASDSSIVKVAAGTTIAVNALEIKDRIRQAKAAMKATKKTVQKIGKKIAGK